MLARALCHIDNAYWIPNVRVNGRIAKTHKTSQTAFRGFGGPQGMLVIEDILGRCAPLLGIDPVDLRRRNFYAEGQTTPYGQPVRHPERAVTCWDQVLDDRRRRRAPGARSRPTTPRHEHTKRALGVTPVKFGISFNLTAFNQAGALVHVYKDGSVLINHGGTEMGQGLHTKMLQVAATTLGVPLSTVRLAPTRTDKVPNTSATAASSGADLNGGAVKNACEQILERLRGRRERLGCAGDVRSRRSGRARRPTERAVGRAGQPGLLQRVQLWAAGFYRTEGLHWDSSVMQGSPFKYFSYGVAASEVEVDGFTGAYRLRRVDIVHDVGDSLSPLVDIGQIEGGFVQGAGWLTLEDLRWDESDRPTRGRLATQAASTYKLPSFSEMPEVFNVALLERAHEDGAVYGSKAVGEPPLMLAFSVREALRQAAAAFGPAGRQRRPGLAGHARGGLLGGRAGARGGTAHGHVSDGRGRTGRRARPARRRTPHRLRPQRPSTARPARAADATDADVHWLRGRRARCAASAGPGCSSRSSSVRGHAPREAGAKMVVAADGDVGQHRRRQPRGHRGRRGPARCSPRARPSRSSWRCPSTTRRRPSTASSAAAARCASCSSRWPSCRRWRSSAWATSGWSWPASSPATTSSCTSSTPARDQLGPRPARRARRRRRRGCTSTTPRSPSSSSARCRPAPTCWS